MQTEAEKAAQLGLIQRFEELLRKAESGEINGIIYSTYYTDGKQVTGGAGQLFYEDLTSFSQCLAAHHAGSGELEN